jgi:hypothetical protein
MLGRLAAVPFVLCPLLSCSSSGDDGGDPPFDHRAIFENFQHDVAHRDVPFPKETPTLFRTADVLPLGLEVHALLEHEGMVYAGTSGGLVRMSPGGLAFVEVSGVAGPIVDLASRGSVVIAAAPHRVDVIGGLVDSYPQTSTVTSVVVAGGEIWVGTSSGLLRLDGTPLVPGVAVRDLAASADTIFMATSSGVARRSIDGQTPSPITAPAIADDDVRAVAIATNGDLLVASRGGFTRVPSTGSSTILGAGLEALPTGELTSIVERDGVVLMGHAIGATAERAGRIEHYHSHRWIPDQRVTSVLLLEDGSRWIGTPAGLTRIAYVETTLAERAEADEALLQARHWRMDGFVDDDVFYDDPWDLSRGLHTGDHDNDGLWTEMQIGAWCYAYAVTKEERFYTSARRAMDVMMLQVRIPALTFEAAGKKRGFITRSLVRDDEGAVFEDKRTQSNWHLQEYEGRQYFWKDDTSSDEYVGHFFGVPLFYDLCAKSEAEKDELREWARQVMDYVIDGGYVLPDLDGERTTHGYWRELGVAWNGLDPCIQKYGEDYLDECVGSRHGQGWLNSAEMLGHLLATWHMTGDTKYYDEYERLAGEGHYADMIKVIDDTFTVTRPGIANHSDHELAMLAYITLLRYDPNLARREQYIQSLLDFYEYEREEHNPWQIGVIGGVHPGDVDLAGAIQTLKDMPGDWRQWRYDNGHRKDSRRNGVDRHQRPQFERVFPYDEIRTMKWNGSPYAVEGGGSGQGVLAPTPYLIAYWTMRYHGMIE